MTGDVFGIWWWGGFTVFILAMLALDLGVFHRKAHEVRPKEALIWSVVWIALAVVFNAIVWTQFGRERGMEFAAGYLIEKSLSVDNVFVFVVIFTAFAVPKLYQHRVLFWGVLGALVMRAVFIAAGSALLREFHWIIYVFGALLIVTGFKLLRDYGASRPQDNPVVRFFSKRLRVTEGYEGQSFLVRRNGLLYATPLLIVLLAVEMTDLIFAVDSIPAIFAVTKDPFIVFTSNAFAILGLRALYFLLADVVQKFWLLKRALAAILLFVGTKMMLSEVRPIPIGVSLGVIAALLAGAVIASLLVPRPTLASESGVRRP